MKKIVFRNTLSDDKEYVYQIKKVHIFLFKYAFVLIMIVILVSIAPAFATSAAVSPALSPIATRTLGDPQELEIFIDGIMASQLIDQNVAGATVVVVCSGQVLLAKGYGYADFEKKIPVDPERTLFRPGSVTKLFTWTAVMHLVELGKIDLQADVNTYLTHFKIPATYQQPITMLDLMAHTAGFEERFKNLFKSSEAEMTSLEEYLEQNMPARVFPPGLVPAYSNYGTALAGYIIEQISGESYEQYIKTNIFIPLGMDHSTMEQPLPAVMAQDMSQGYSFNGSYQAEEFELVQGSPAGGLSASGLDMGNFMLAHLQDGEFNGARILKTETAQLMHNQSYTFDAVLPGMAHGFMEAHINGHRLIWHGGDTFLFHTLLALLPEEQTGIYISYNSDPGLQTRDAFLRAFMDRYFPGKPISIIPPPADFASRMASYIGFYETSRKACTTYEKVFASILAVQPGPDNTLRIPDLASWNMSDAWIEVRPFLMQNARTGEYAVFRKDDLGDELYAAIGNWPIEILIKLPWYGGPLFKFGLLGFSMITSLFTVIAAIVTKLISLRKRKAGQYSTWPARLARWIALLLCVLTVILIVIILMVFIVGLEHISSISEAVISLLPWVIAILTTIVTPLAGFAWCKRWWGLIGRIHYSVIVLASLGLLWFEIYWRLIAI